MSLTEILNGVKLSQRWLSSAKDNEWYLGKHNASHSIFSASPSNTLPLLYTSDGLTRWQWTTVWLWSSITDSIQSSCLFFVFCPVCQFLLLTTNWTIDLWNLIDLTIRSQNWWTVNGDGGGLSPSEHRQLTSATTGNPSVTSWLIHLSGTQNHLGLHHHHHHQTKEMIWKTECHHCNYPPLVRTSIVHQWKYTTPMQQQPAPVSSHRTLP